MKKTRVIIPALAITAFSMAASITGAVAWFTANRVATVTAGEFAVVNTSSNLLVSLDDGIGTTATDNEPTHTIDVESGYKLTDCSFDHSLVAQNIVTPDITGTKVGRLDPLASVAAADLLRDEANHVYTAFTWEMTFTVEFAGSASFDAGLFLDLSSEETYMHRKVSYAVGDPVNNVAHYSDAACTTSASVAVDGEGKATAAATVYEVAPIETGKAFRIAFAATSIGGSGSNTSIAYSKVWAANEDAAHCGFVTGLAVDDSLARTAYGTASTKASGNNASSAISAETLASGMVLMDSSSDAGIPANGAKTHAQALSTCNNYLGLFKLDPGKSVSLTFKCVAWFDGTDTAEGYGHIVNNATDFENIVSSMHFGVANLANA